MFSAIPFFTFSRSVLKIKTITLLILLSYISTCDDNSSELRSNAISVEKQAKLSREYLSRGAYQDLVLESSLVKTLNQMALIFDLYEGLTAYDVQGNLQPALAESWQTEDNKIWFFILRENAMWSNGEPIRAQDFVYSWRQLALSDNPQKSYLAFMHIENVESVLKNKLAVEKLGVEAVDERILRVQLDKPIPYLPEMLAHIALLPKYASSAAKLVSNGAYQLEEFSADKAILSKNPFYWQKERVSFKEVEYKKLSKDKVVNVDFLWQTTQATDYFPQLCTYYYEFNLAHPLLSKKSVRKALSSMISSANLVRNNPQMTALTQVLPQALKNTTEPVWENVIVEQLLEQNGINENHPLDISLTYDQGQPHQQISEQLMRIWGQLDLLRIRADALSYQQLLMRRAKGEFHIIRSGWCADYKEPSAFLNQFHSENIDNKIAYRNSEFDKLLEQTLQEQDPKARQAIYRQLEQILQQDYVLLPIAQQNIPVFIERSIAGFDHKNATGLVYSKDLYRRVNVPK